MLCYEWPVGQEVGQHACREEEGGNRRGERREYEGLRALHGRPAAGQHPQQPLTPINQPFRVASGAAPASAPSSAAAPSGWRRRMVWMGYGWRAMIAMFLASSLLRAQGRSGMQRA